MPKHPIAVQGGRHDPGLEKAVGFTLRPSARPILSSDSGTLIALITFWGSLTIDTSFVPETIMSPTTRMHWIAPIPVVFGVLASHAQTYHGPVGRQVVRA